jgi:hypothetical protein
MATIPGLGGGANGVDPRAKSQPRAEEAAGQDQLRQFVENGRRAAQDTRATQSQQAPQTPPTADRVNIEAAAREAQAAQAETPAEREPQSTANNGAAPVAATGPAETAPPTETAQETASPTAREAAAAPEQSTTAEYNAQNPNRLIAEREIGGTVNVRA